MVAPDLVTPTTVGQEPLTAAVRVVDQSLVIDALPARPWQDDDIDVQLSAWRDPTFRAFSDWAPATARDARKRMEAQRAKRAEGLDAAFAIYEPGSSRDALGEVSVNDVDLRHRTGCLGYWLVPTARGRGVATRAVRLAAQFAFDQLDLVRVELTCGPDNDASAAVAKRAGFTFEGRLRSNDMFKGAPRDSLVFSVLRDETPR